MSSFIEFVAWAFTATNAVRALFYVPQIIAVARSADGARDIALVTWWMWLVNNLLGAIYAWLALANEALARAFMASVFGCGATILLTLYKRLRMPALRVVEREAGCRDLPNIDVPSSVSALSRGAAVRDIAPLLYCSACAAVRPPHACGVDQADSPASRR